MDLLNIGDAILSINDEDITTSTHDQVINQLHDTPGGQVTLTVKYMKEMATYLHLTTEKSRPSVSHSSLTLPRRYLIRESQEQKRLSAEYPLEYRDDTNRQRWSLLLPDQPKSKVRPKLHLPISHKLYICRSLVIMSSAMRKPKNILFSMHT